MRKNGFVKSQGLGNEYLILEEGRFDFPLTEKAIQRICDVHFGIGSDGILLKTDSVRADFGLRIFNPDGSEAEKSGNGLRIYSKFLYDYGYAKESIFSVETKGGLVRAEVTKTVNRKANRITVEMGKAIFKSKEIPTAFEAEEAIGQKITALDRSFEVNCVSVGNPHCVILVDQLSVEEVKKYGPFLERHPIFPNRINVQFVKVLSRSSAEILIWERGAGYTLASGSSSSGVAGVLKKKGLIDREVAIKMPGGELSISVGDDWNIRMEGEVRQTAEGMLGEELIEELYL